MLCMLNTEFGTGVTIWGDHQDFEAVRDVIYELLENSPFNEDVRDTVRALSYDLRKADEEPGSEHFELDAPRYAKYKGVKVLWPVLLFQVKVLREAAKYQPTTKQHQAILYLLESQVESALMEYDPFVGNRCKQWLNSAFTIPADYLTSFLESQLFEFVQAKGGKERFKQLPDLLYSLDFISTAYRQYDEELEAIAREQGIDKHELEDCREFPNFEW